jgi:hypothetical protein
LEKSCLSEVRSAARELEVDQEVRFKFDVTIERKKSCLWLEVFKDDLEACDLYVYGDREFVDRVDSATREFVNSDGQE